jgi:hypothetical protein
MQQLQFEDLLLSCGSFLRRYLHGSSAFCGGAEAACFLEQILDCLDLDLRVGPEVTLEIAFGGSRSCGAPMPCRDGQFVLKYFHQRNGGGRRWEKGMGRADRDKPGLRFRPRFSL